MTDQQDIRNRVTQRRQQQSSEQFATILAGLKRVLEDDNLAEFHLEADWLANDLHTQQTVFRANTPPDIKTVEKYMLLMQRVQAVRAPKTTPRLKVSPSKAPPAHDLNAQLAALGIDLNSLVNFNAPIAGGALGAPPPPPGGAGPGRSSTLPADIAAFSAKYQAELNIIGQNIFTQLEQNVLDVHMREAAMQRLQQIRDAASRQVLRFPFQGPPQAAIRDIERSADMLNRRLSGQASQLGFAGAEKFRYDQDVAAPMQSIIQQGISGQRISQDDYLSARRAIEIRRGEIRSNPDIDASLARRRTEALAQVDRQASQLARLFPEIVQRGTPGSDLSGVSPGAVSGFANLQSLRQQFVGAQQGPMGQITSTRQQDLLRELAVQQQLLRIEQDRLRAQGEMTKDRQHRFNVLQNEYRLTEHAVEGSQVRMMPGDISRQAALGGGGAMVGHALQQIAAEHGDIRGTSGMAVAGQLMAQGGMRGLLMGGLAYGGSRAALATAGAVPFLGGRLSSGGTGALIGGLGAMAPVLGIGAVAGGLALALSQIHAVTTMGGEATSLFRRGAGRPGQALGAGFGAGAEGSSPTFLQEIMNMGQGFAFNREQALEVASTLASTGGVAQGQGALAFRSGQALRGARVLGMNPTALAQGMGTLESVNMLGPGQGGMDQEKFIDMLAQGIEKGRMRGRETEVLTAITDLTKEFALRGASLPNMPAQTAGLITAMNASGIAGLRGQYGEQMLSTMDQSITGAKGVSQALLYQSYAKQAGGHLNYLDFMIEQGQGLGSQYARGAWNDIGALGGEDPNRRAFVLTNQFFGGDMKQFLRVKQLDEIMKGNPSQEDWEKAVAGTMDQAQAHGGLYGSDAGLVGTEPLADAQNKLTNTIQNWASDLTPAMAKITETLTNFSETVRGIAEGKADAVGDIFGGLKDAIGGKLDEIKKFFEENFKGYTDKIGTAVGAAVTGALSGLATQIASAIRGAFGMPGAAPPGSPAVPGAIPLPWGGAIRVPDIHPEIEGPGGIKIPNPLYPGAPSGETPNVPAPGPSAPAAPGLPPSEGPPAGGMPAGADSFATQTQPTNDTCGPTSMAMILTNAGMPTTEQEARQAMQDFLGYDPVGPKGMYWSKVAEFVNWYSENHGNALRATQGPSATQIMANMEAGQPAMFSINTDAAARLGFPSGSIPHIVAGVSASNGRYTIADPASGKLMHLSRDEMSQIVSDDDAKSVSFQNYGGPGSRQPPSLPPAGDEGLPITPASPSPGGTIGGTRVQNANAIVRTALEEAATMGYSPEQALNIARTLLSAAGHESGIDDPMRFQYEKPFDHTDTGRHLGIGLFQFDPGGVGPGYVNWLKEQGIVPPEATFANIQNYPQAWTPELQTRYFMRAERANLNVPMGTREERAGAAAGLERPKVYMDAGGGARGRAAAAPYYLQHAAEADEFVQQYLDQSSGSPPAGSPWNMDPGNRPLLIPEPPPESYTPLGPGGMAAASAMRVVVTAPQTVTLVDSNGAMLGSIPINAYVDIPNNADMGNNRSMNYYNG